MVDALDSDDLVLVVDDEEAMRDATSAVLESKGHKVTIANSGSEAMGVLKARLERFGEARLKAIVSDWVMAGGDGIELVASIRKVEAFKMIPFLLVSGAVTREQLAGAMRHDIDGILLKPFTREGLLAKLNEAMVRRQEKDLSSLLTR